MMCYGRLSVAITLQMETWEWNLCTAFSQTDTTCRVEQYTQVCRSKQASATLHVRSPTGCTCVNMPSAMNSIAHPYSTKLISIKASSSVICLSVRSIANLYLKLFYLILIHFICAREDANFAALFT